MTWSPFGASTRSADLLNSPTFRQARQAGKASQCVFAFAYLVASCSRQQQLNSSEVKWRAHSICKRSSNLKWGFFFSLPLFFCSLPPPPPPFSSSSRHAKWSKSAQARDQIAPVSAAAAAVCRQSNSSRVSCKLGPVSKKRDHGLPAIWTELEKKKNVKKYNVSLVERNSW